MLVVIEEHGKHFAAQEMEALRNSGLKFQIVPQAKLFHPPDPIDHFGDAIFLRTSVQTAAKYEEKYRGWFLNKNSSTADHWYTLPRDNRWFSYFRRHIGHVQVFNNGDDFEVPGLREILKAMATHDGVFVKSINKSSFGARLFDSTGQAYTEVMEMIAFGCHRMPTGFMVSTPLLIDPADTDFKKEEYRLFVIGQRVATSSIFTDKPGHGVPDIINQFGNNFAAAYSKDLPRSYCLDIALSEGKPVVIELNDIHASGLFADHDMEKFYKAIEEEIK